jgi:hypothetical protein
MDLRDLQPKGQGQGTPAPKLHETKEPKASVAVPAEAPQTQSEPSIQDQTTPPMDGQELVQTMLIELAEEGYTEADAFEILDNLLTEGEHVFEFSLLNKLPCKFRVRPDWVQQHAVQSLEVQGPKTVARLTDIINRYNLAGALMLIGKTKFEVKTPEDLDACLAYLQEQPFAMINMLLNKLVIFDKLVAVASSPWALENFIEPRPAE